MYQLEAKLALVRVCFNPSNGWKVHVAVDAMELARGGAHKPDKAIRAAAAYAELKRLGANLVDHPIFGAVDVVAEHHDMGTRLIEVEGESSRQPEQAMYSALGQVVLSMKIKGSEAFRYGIAAPNTPQWNRQFRKIPPRITKLLMLDLYLAGDSGVSISYAGEEIPDWSRG